MDSTLLTARISDTADLAFKTDNYKFLGFLSLEEAVLEKKVLENRNVKFSLFGGYDLAERVMLCCLPSWGDTASFPITAVTFSYREVDKLTHRDFLGALMSLGLTRESIGDILVGEGRAVAFLSDDVAHFVFTQLEKIGRVGVTLQKGYKEPLPSKGELLEFSVTVASARLDCVVAALTNSSRNTATEMILGGLVSVNSQITEKPTKQVFDGDALSCRGKGKFIISSLRELTRKNRIVLKYKKYV